MRRLYARAPVQFNRNEKTAFLAALFAVVLWGCMPLLRNQATSVPPLQMTAIALTCAALVEFWRDRLVEGRPDSTGIRLPWMRLSGLAISLVGAIAFYFLALDLAPGAQVTLVTYTWPLMFVSASEILTRGRVRSVVLAGGAVAFTGCGALVLSDAGPHGVGLDTLLGYALGLASGVCWVGYSLLLRHGRTLGPGAWPRVFLLGALAALLLHLGLEATLWPLPAHALTISAAIGVGPYGLAFVAWAYGVRRGPARSVGLLAYAVPLVASALLIAIGASEPGWPFAFGTAAVLGGVALSNANLGNGPKQA
ncbi:DMT family transporter [Rhodovibrio salinarum]|uniref:EamA/RhaT family transporter n=1 Tax=Rhodovibrio salinarum TaxID=1087 RepID=A0A934QKN0_9PROT|nr:DMT family transporter [Rhodovibrio salinarum]MBK1698643.1 EamA/RhaT family transporter [Rhodovibrio salinarum]